MIYLNEVIRLSEQYEIPLEDILFIALNIYGVKIECNYPRLRMNFHLGENKLFEYARKKQVLDYFFALAVNSNSDFLLNDEILSLHGNVIGKAINPQEDTSELSYFRRNKTVLNFNPNSRSSCAGCDFCYTSHLTPNDERKINSYDELKAFFENWMSIHNLTNLSHLIQIALVTGNYKRDYDLCEFLLKLKRIITEYDFKGNLFYLGSQITTIEQLKKLIEIQPFSICYSIELFERRDILRKDKETFDLTMARQAMSSAMNMGYEVSFTYIIGLEPLYAVEKYFKIFKDYINRFPLINIFQRHNFHSQNLLDNEASSLEYFLDSRKIIENIFVQTQIRPLLWDNYRSLWSLTFDKENLTGVRIPYL